MDSRTVAESSTSRRRAVGLSLVAIVAFACLIVVTSPAEACCTNILCEHCKSSFTETTCMCYDPPRPVPRCNAFACACLEICQCKKLINGFCNTWECCKDGAAGRADALARFNEIDTNKDGKISVDEGWDWTGRNEPWDKWIKSLNPKEYAEPLRAFAAVEPTEATKKALFRAAFDSMDRDHDGYVLPGELDPSLASSEKSSQGH